MRAGSMPVQKPGRGKPRFRREAVRELLHALFQDVSSLEPMAGGEESQTFRFDSAGQALVLRLNAGQQSFAKDRFACQRFCGPELPIPEVMLIGEFEDHVYCVSPRVPGRTLQDLDPESVASLVFPVRRVWGAIAASDIGGISGCGPFDGTGRTGFATWRDFVMAVAPAANHIPRWIDRLASLAEAIPERRALIHGDFGSNNVLADGGRVSGVVDWSEAMIGDPLYDVANIFFWRTWLPCMEQQARHFEAHPPEEDDWQRRILCYQLRIGILEVLQASETADWAWRRCEEIMQAADKHAGAQAGNSGIIAL